MYEQFFDLAQRPFSAVPHADDFVSIPTVQDGLDALVYCVSQSRGIGVVTSAPGMGKTLVCKRLASLLADQTTPVYLSTSSFHTRRALLQAILFELQINYVGLSEQEARLQLLETARRMHSEGRGVLLIVDEAHLLNPRLFEELRTLADYAPDGKTLIRLVLCGQFELEEKLADPALSAFNQRIGAQVCLEPLTMEQSVQFLVERLRAAGAKDVFEIFTEEALELICRASDGNFRCLTQLADHALLLAFAAEQKPVDEVGVRSALDDLKELPLQWGEIPDASRLAEVVQDQVPLRPDWDAGLLEEEETESSPTNWLPVPLEATAPEEELSADHWFTLEKDSEADDEAARAAGKEFESEPVFYAVIEVGNSTGSAGKDAESDQKKPDADESPAIQEPEVTATSDWEYTPRPSSVSFTETPVIDHYAALDRQRELPQERRGELPSPPVPDTQKNDEITRYPYLATAGTGWPQESEPVTPRLTEEELLECVERMRREIIDKIEESEPRIVEDSSPFISRTASYDIVQPQTGWEGAQRDPVVETPPPAQERRFAQLFTRLRTRRRQIEAELSR